MDVSETLRTAAARLAPSDTARLDAELLMAHAFGTTRTAMLLHRQQDPPPPAFAALVARRAIGEPLAHITGRAEFYGLPLEVTPDVLIPRGDSETLIEAAREAMADRLPARILDLGTGSGALLLAALHLWPGAEGIGIDRSAATLLVARRNAAALGLPAGFGQADWNTPGCFDGFGRFDLVLANPPYVEEDAALENSVRDHEPAGALFAGVDGLDAYRVLIPRLPQLLAPGGVAIIEIGATQNRAVCSIAQGAALSARMHRDLAGRPRALTLRRKT